MTPSSIVARAKATTPAPKATLSVPGVTLTEFRAGLLFFKGLSVKLGGRPTRLPRRGTRERVIARPAAAAARSPSSSPPDHPFRLDVNAPPGVGQAEFTGERIPSHDVRRKDGRESPGVPCPSEELFPRD